MKTIWKIIAVVIFILMAVASPAARQPSPLYAQSADAGNIVHLQVNNCNNNGICEPQFGENYLGCPLDCPGNPPPPPPPVHHPSANHSLDPYNISVTVNEDLTALITWNTYDASVGYLSWGRTAETADGTIAEINFGIEHAIQLTSLQPNSQYFFKIETRSEDGRHGQSSVYSFITPSLISSPQNITDFHFQLVGQDILLLWQNPNDPNFQKTIILRSDIFYPNDPQGPGLIYEGQGTTTLDQRVKVFHDYYYTAFAEDIYGHYSSGVTLHVRLIPYTEKLASSTSSVLPTIIQLSDIGIEQNRHQVYFSNGIAEIEKNIPIRFFIGESALPTGTNEIILNIENEFAPGSFTSSLMRTTVNDHVYEATVPAFTSLGQYRFLISALNKKNQTIGQAGGILEVIKQKSFCWYCYLWEIYKADYYVAYFFGFLDYLGWLVIHI